MFDYSNDVYCLATFLDLIERVNIVDTVEAASSSSSS